MIPSDTTRIQVRRSPVLWASGRSVINLINLSSDKAGYRVPGRQGRVDFGSQRNEGYGEYLGCLGCVSYRLTNEDQYRC